MKGTKSRGRGKLKGIGCIQNCSIQLLGWGKPHVGGDPVHMLQELKVPIVNHKKCHDRNAASGRSVTEKMICSGHNNGLEFSSGLNIFILN